MMVITGTNGFIGGQYRQRHIERSIPIPHATDPWLCSAWRNTPKTPIVHLGAVSGVLECRDNPGLAFRDNVVSTHEYMTFAREHGARFVFVSSAAAANPRTVYGATKAASEAQINAWIRECDLNACILRLCNVYGPGSRDKNSAVAKMCKDALATGKITLEGGSQRRYFCYIGDVMNALDACLEMGISRAQCVGNAITIEELAERIAHALNASIEVVPHRPNDTESDLDLYGYEFRSTVDFDAALNTTIEYFRGLYG